MPGIDTPAACRVLVVMVGCRNSNDDGGVGGGGGGRSSVGGAGGGGDGDEGETGGDILRETFGHKESDKKRRDESDNNKQRLENVHKTT